MHLPSKPSPKPNPLSCKEKYTLGQYSVTPARKLRSQNVCNRLKKTESPLWNTQLTTMLHLFTLFFGMNMCVQFCSLFSISYILYLVQYVNKDTYPYCGRCCCITRWQFPFWMSITFFVTTLCPGINIANVNLVA